MLLKIAKTTKPLTNTGIDRAKSKPKIYTLSDGGGLQLRVKPNGSKIWLLDYYRPHTKVRTSLSLGSYPALSLATARLTCHDPSFIVCAQKVLEEFGEGKPMHYREITRKALEQGWLVTAGKTPESTMGAQMGGKIRNQKKRGEQPLFVQHTRGYIGLSQWMKADDESQDPKSLGSSGL